MGEPFVSVVIPTRNRAGLVTATLRSVLNQRKVAVEVIVVDDASSDGTVDALARLNDDRVKVLSHSSQLGVGAARNTGISASHGRWLAFVDDDDLFAPDKLASQLTAIDKTPGARWSCVGVVVVDDALRIIDWIEAPPTTDLSTEMLRYDAVPGGGSGVLVSRDLLDDAGWFDPDLSCHEDWDMWLRLAQRSIVATVHRPLTAYRVHGSTMSMGVDVCDREFHTLCAKHATLFTARGSEPDHEFWSLAKARLYVRAGQRKRALETLYSLRRTDDRRRLSRAVLVAVVPGSIKLNDARLRRKVPRQWRADAESWLSAYR